MDHETSRLRATGHPVRLRILSLLTGTELSATDVARELGLTHANASYHLRVLERSGLVVAAGEEKVRGGVVKRYRHPWREGLRERPAESHGAARASTAEGDAYARAAAEELVRRSRHRLRGTPATATDAELWVAPEVWERVRDLITEASVLLHDSAQPPRHEGAVMVNLTAFAFRMDPDAASEVTR